MSRVTCYMRRTERAPRPAGNTTRVSWFSPGGSKLEKHLQHAIDLGGLIDVHVGREFEDGLILARAVGLEELFDHGDGAAVMLDHESEKEPVEVRTARGVQLAHLLGREHARH